MPAKRHYLLAFPALAYVAILCLFPLAIVAEYSFRVRDYGGGVDEGYSLTGWTRAVERGTLRSVARSAALALGVTASTLAIGYPCALAIASLDSRRRKTMIALIVFPLVTSLLLRIYGWINLLPFQWRGTILSVGLVMAVNYLPFMILPILRALERSEPNVIHAALDLGATPWQAFWRVTWPITRPGTWAGAALVFIPCCGEYLVPDLIGNGKVTVVGGIIVEQFVGQGRNWPYAAACAIWLSALVILPITASLAIKRD